MDTKSTYHSMDPRTHNNYRNALAQLYALERHFSKNPEYHDNYENSFQMYLAAGFIKEVENPKIEGYYLPYFGVKKQSLTTLLRIVFNTSSKVNGELSLNDCLFPGPTLAIMLYDLLIKFHSHPYALLSYISKYTHFLWRRKPLPVATYAFQVVVFGVTTNPYILQQVLRTHLQEKGREELMKSFYVNNYIQTFESYNQLEDAYVETKSLLDEAHMPLTGWASNCQGFNERLDCNEPNENANFCHL
ncbi:uncharacterized protein LOC135208534 [Macrobrachium nipponense]|uniref:uncharacterized protein LOC135208534 n=1 Tax=Macrobrachium nipponense TaxID=159736 RepID=UPI0030C81BF3